MVQLLDKLRFRLEFLKQLLNQLLFKYVKVRLRLFKMLLEICIHTTNIISDF